MTPSRSPLLIEAVKGGLQAQDHEVHAHIAYEAPENTPGPKRRPRLVYKSITHDDDGKRVRSLGDALRDNKDILANADRKPTVHVSIRKRGGPTVTSMEVTRRKEDEESEKDDAHPKTGLPVVRSARSATAKQSERKGWATTLFNHVGRKLKRTGLRLDHDWGKQSNSGKRWALRTSGATPHRSARSSEAITKSMEKSFPHLRDHHPAIKSLAQRILDQGAGFYDTKHLGAFRRAARKMSLPFESNPRPPRPPIKGKLTRKQARERDRVQGLIHRADSNRDIRRILGHHGGHPVRPGV